MEHSNINLCLVLLNFIILIFPTLVLSEPQVPCFFIFGDSIVDNGNNNYLKTTAKVNYLPYGIDFPAGPTGRFTNGRNIADIIAELLGFDKPIPPFFNATDQELLQGVNYASGGAGILDETGSFYGDVITLNEQLSNHKVTTSKIAKLLGGKRAAKEYLRSCIYYVGMGNNDYLGNYLPQLYSSNTQYTPEQFADILIKQYSKHLLKLYVYGARKVAVFPVGKLGCIPQQIASYGTSDASTCFETTNNIAQIFNEKLQLLLDNLNNRLPSAQFVYSRDISDNPSYGNIKNLSDPCCSTTEESGGYCVEGAVVCSNRDEYYFWDLYHPTEAANLIGANIAYNYMAPLYANSIDVI